MMKKLGLTQRVTRIEQYNEKRDGLDQRWWPLADALGYLPVPLANLPPAKAESYMLALGLSAIIITGGEADPTRDAFEMALIESAIKHFLPIVGVCRGMQILNQYFGGTLLAVNEHRARRHAITFCNEWSQLSPREVNSYHDFGIFTDNLAKTLHPTAVLADGSIEAFVHPQYKLSGIMWHPEREFPLSEADLKLLRGLLS